MDSLFLWGMGAFVGAMLGGTIALQPCPPEFRLGQTYNEVRDGICPDIEKQARFQTEDLKVGYYCPSKNVMVIGDMVTGKVVGYFLYEKE